MLFFYPNNIEIIDRRIMFNHSEGILKRTVTEEIVFRNISNWDIKEIAIETERELPNADLSITDENKGDIIYLTNEELNNKPLPPSIKAYIEEKDKYKRKYILWIVLNKYIHSQDYGVIFLKYTEPAPYTMPIGGLKYNKQDTNSESSRQGKYENHKFLLYLEVYYLNVIDFYSKETLKISSRWEDALEMNTYNFFAVKQDNSILDISNSENICTNDNYIAFDISNSKRIQKNVSKILVLQSFIPEKQQIKMIYGLTWFSLLFPFTDFISIYLSNMSYLFDFLELEIILILTLAFAETRTRLMGYKQYLRYALFLTGVLFIISLAALLGLFNFIPKLLQQLWIL